MNKLKNFAIFGDSYSTFEGYVPKGHAVYYDTKDTKEIGVTEVGQTWWYRLKEATGAELIFNDSWSGSTVCYTAYNGRDCSADSSFIKRMRDRLAAGELLGVDTLFVFGCTNDSWANSPLGEFKEGQVEQSELYSVLPAVCYTARLLSEQAVGVRVIYIVNTSLKPEISDCIKTACEKYGHEYVVLQNVQKKNGHPDPTGMEQICEQVLKHVTESENEG